MELLSNSVWVDAKLFPKVDKVTMLDATPFLRARLRGSFTPGQAVRLDTAFVSWNVEGKVLGKMPQLLMALNIPKRPGLTLLRQYLGSEAENFTNIVLDPEQPDVVTLVGPRRLPTAMPEGLNMVDLDTVLCGLNFEQLHGTTKAVIALLKYLQARSPMEIGETLLNLENGWGFRCVTREGEHPVFTLERMVGENLNVYSAT